MIVSLPTHARAAAFAACLIAPVGPVAAAGVSTAPPPASTETTAAAAAEATDRCQPAAPGAGLAHPSQRDLLLAGMALMVGIALRRASA